MHESVVEQDFVYHKILKFKPISLFSSEVKLIMSVALNRDQGTKHKQIILKLNYLYVVCIIGCSYKQAAVRVIFWLATTTTSKDYFAKVIFLLDANGTCWILTSQHLTL